MGQSMGSRARAGRQLLRSFARQLLGCSSSIFSTRLFLLTGSEKPPARRSCWRRLRAPREAASCGGRGWTSRELSPAARAEVERARRRVAGGDGLLREEQASWSVETGPRVARRRPVRKSRGGGRRGRGVRATPLCSAPLPSLGPSPFFSLSLSRSLPGLGRDGGGREDEQAAKNGVAAI